jgi:hypothetical protein
MHRCGSGFLLTLTITLVLAFTGCLGKSSSSPGNGGVATVSVSPSGTISIDVGSTQVFSASGKDANGRAVLGANIQFLVVSGNPNASAPLSIASSGNACAGTWDPTGTMCSPGTPGIALVSAVINGVSSAQTTVYVHQHIDNIQISPLTTQGQPQPQYDCFSQGQSWNYQAVAYSEIGGSSLDITNTVGPMNWLSKNAGVATTTPLLNSQPNVLNQVQVTAKTPGITELFVSVSGVISNYYPFTTCPVQAIWLQIGGQNQAGNSITVNNGGTVPVTAIAVDTLCGTANNTPLSSLPLTWSTTNPEVIAFSSTTGATVSSSAAARNNSGGATLTASCTPPTCNIGLPGLTPSGVIVPSLPIYASNYDSTAPPSTHCQPPNLTKGYSAISVDVVPSPASTTKPPVYTAWAATTGCADAIGCSSAMFAVTPGTTPIGQILQLPRTPNSMMFNHVSSARVYLGSDQGLMYVDLTASNPSATLVSNSSTCNVALCGTVLTISNDGKLVVVSDPPTASSPGEVYIYNGGSSSTAPVDLILSNTGETATAAAFSPDQLKLFIATSVGNLYVYSTVDAFTLVPPVPPASGATFATAPNALTPSRDGSFAYVAVPPASTVFPAALIPGFVSGFANCNTPASEVEPLSDVLITSPSINANPLALYPLPTLQFDSSGNPTEVVLALDAPEAQQTPLPPAPPPPPPPPTTIDMFGVTVEQFPLPYNQFVCNPPAVTLDTNFPQTTVNLGQGNFTPIYSQLVADGAEVLIVAQNIPAVLLFNVSNGTTTSIPLANNANPLSASASTDGTQVFVAACDQYDGTSCAVGSVHIISTNGQGDYQQVPYVNVSNNNNRNMCSNGGNPVPQCLPNLIALRPQ